MKTDAKTLGVITDAISNYEDKHGKTISIEKVVRIMNAYYRGTKKILEKDEPTAIKLDFFGKINYNVAKKEKVEKMKEGFKILKQRENEANDNQF